MAARKSRPTSVKAARAKLEAAAQELSAMADRAEAVNTGPLDLALSSEDVLDRLAPKIVRAGAQPEVYYIPTSTPATWVVFLFPPWLPPLTFRVSVDLVSRTVGAIEDPYIPDRTS